MKTAPPVILAPFMAVHRRQLKANRWGLHMKGRTVGRARPAAQSHRGAPGGAQLRLTAQGLHLRSPRPPTSTSADSRCRSDQCSHSVEFSGSPNNLEFDWTADKMTQSPKGSKATLDSPEYSLLLKQYGNAMSRNGRLEAEIERLAHQLVDGASRQTADSDSVPHTPSSAEDINNLRLQLHDMANRLALTESELKEAQGNRPRRRKKRPHSKPWWKKVARQLGLARSEE